MAKNQYPEDEGWMRMELTMTSKKPRSEEELKKIATLGEVDKYEFGSVEQYGTKVKVILREKNWTERVGSTATSPA